jgi:hypothetical protein
VWCWTFCCDCDCRYEIEHAARVAAEIAYEAAFKKMDQPNRPTLGEIRAQEEVLFLRQELAAAKCCDSHQNIVDQLQGQIDVEHAARVAAEADVLRLNNDCEADNLARLRAELRARELETEHQATIGVGNGDGKLFVHGSYDAVKVLQDKLIRLGELEAKLADADRVFGEQIRDGHIDSGMTIDEVFSQPGPMFNREVGHGLGVKYSDEQVITPQLPPLVVEALRAADSLCGDLAIDREAPLLRCLAALRDSGVKW